jgi:hypothetical protein
VLQSQFRWFATAPEPPKHCQTASRTITALQAAPQARSCAWRMPHRPSPPFLTGSERPSAFPFCYRPATQLPGTPPRANPSAPSAMAAPAESPSGDSLPIPPDGTGPEGQVIEVAEDRYKVRLPVVSHLPVVDWHALQVPNLAPGRYWQERLGTSGRQATGCHLFFLHLFSAPSHHCCCYLLRLPALFAALLCVMRRSPSHTRAERRCWACFQIRMKRSACVMC